MNSPTQTPPTNPQHLSALAHGLLAIAKGTYRRSNSGRIQAPTKKDKMLFAKAQTLLQSMLTGLAADLRGMGDETFYTTPLSMAISLARTSHWEFVHENTISLTSDNEVFYKPDSPVWLIPDLTHPLSTWGFDTYTAFRVPEDEYPQTGSDKADDLEDGLLLNITDPVCLRIFSVVEKMRQQTLFDLGVSLDSDPSTYVEQLENLQPTWGTATKLNSWKLQALSQRTQMAIEMVTGVLLFNGALPPRTLIDTVKIHGKKVFGEVAPEPVPEPLLVLK